MTHEQTPKIFVDPDEGFSLHVPEAWMVDTSGQQGSRVVLYGPTVEDTFRANVNVVVQDLAPLSPDEFVSLSRLQLKKLSNMATLPVDEPSPRLAGGHVLEWTTWEAPIPIRGRQLLAFNADQAYIVTALASADSFPLHEPILQAVLDSFEFR